MKLLQPFPKCSFIKQPWSFVEWFLFPVLFPSLLFNSIVSLCLCHVGALLIGSSDVRLNKSHWGCTIQNKAHLETQSLCFSHSQSTTACGADILETSTYNSKKEKTKQKTTKL